MSSLYATIASLTLFLPFAGQFAPADTDSQPSPMSAAPVCNAPGVDALPANQPAQHGETSKPSVPAPLSASNLLEAFKNSGTANQVRIKRSVTIRITPYRQSNRNSLLAQLPRRGVSRDYEEREMASCVPVSGIAGVQTRTGNQLLLFLRDERIINLNLARGCEARDFYSGFYIERNDDGRLCVKRDLLQSRSGAKCEVERMRLLVPARG
jgi:hypothetical protein